MGPTLAENINKPEGSSLNTMNEPLKSSFYMQSVTAQGAINIVNKKSSIIAIDYLDVNFKFIKKTIQVYAYFVLPLTQIIIISFENGLFPNAIKLAEVIPLFETGDTLSFSEYMLK